MTTSVTTYYLEITDPNHLVPAEAPPADFEIRQSQLVSLAWDQFLYKSVGQDWNWIRRWSWSDEQWLKYLDRPELETWVAYLQGTPIGFFELEKQTGDQVEIVQLGLAPGFFGRGLGGAMVTRAIERGWELGAKRVWLHTCTKDHPIALKSYQARGLRVYDQIVAPTDLL